MPKLSTDLGDLVQIPGTIAPYVDKITTVRRSSEVKAVILEASFCLFPDLVPQKAIVCCTMCEDDRTAVKIAEKALIFR